MSHLKKSPPAAISADDVRRRCWSSHAARYGTVRGRPAVGKEKLEAVYLTALKPINR